MKPQRLTQNRTSALSRNHRYTLGTAVAVALMLAGGTAAQADTGSTDSQPITAAEVPLQFTRTTVVTRPAPTADELLIQMMSATAGHPGAAASKGSLASPLTVLTLTSPFGGRTSPIHGATEFHRGQDFSGPCGTAVSAAAGGTVVFAGWHPYGGGNRVEIRHANGLKTTYNHLASFSVAVGQELKRGDTIARVGTTGSSTGCHLHFEVDLHGDVVNPLDWL